jgi:hypothetical protein
MRTDAAKISRKTHMPITVESSGTDQDTPRLGGTPDRLFGRLIHQDVTPVMLNQISDNAGWLQGSTSGNGSRVGSRRGSGFE